VSFGTHVRKVRDPALPLRARVVALRSAVVLYQPLGWNLTLSFLDQAVDGYARGEQALLYALDLLEDSRQRWQAEVDRYAGDRRVAKAEGRRTPNPHEANPLRHPTGWYGPLRSAASRHALAAWTTRLSISDPLDREVAALAAACLAADNLTSDQKATLSHVTAELGRRARRAAAQGDTAGHFHATTAMRVANLVAAAAATVDHPEPANPRHNRAFAATEVADQPRASAPLDRGADAPTGDGPIPAWPQEMLNALRLGRRLVAEIPARPGRRAFVDITPARDIRDTVAAREGWQRPGQDRAFRVEHWDYDEHQINGWDYDIGAQRMRTGSAIDEVALLNLISAWGLKPTDFNYPWNTADPK
jgi:hypothetical protein